MASAHKRFRIQRMNGPEVLQEVTERTEDWDKRKGAGPVASTQVGQRRGAKCRLRFNRKELKERIERRGNGEGKG